MSHLLKPQIVIDCQGERIEKRHLMYAEACTRVLLGEERSQPSFWITRDDLCNDYTARHLVDISMSHRNRIGSEHRHEPSFDLYIDGGIIPVARLINVAIPDFTDEEPR